MSWSVASPGSLFSCLKREKNKTFFQHFRLFEFSLKYGKRESWILDMFFIEIFWCTDQKILIGQHRAKSILDPGVKALKIRILPILGAKNSEIKKKIFFKTAFFQGQLIALITFFGQVHHLGSIAIIRFQLESQTPTQ